MQFEVGPVWTTISFEANEPTAERAWMLDVVNKHTQARPAGYQHMPKFKRHMWDGYIHLLKGNKFPSGLLLHVAKALEGHVSFVVNTTGNYPAAELSFLQPDMFEGITLRNYQIEAVKTLVQKQCGVAKLATNAGKTEIMAALCSVYHEAKVVVLTTRKELLHQTAERLSTRLQEEVGKIGDGLRDMRRVTVATIQTLSADEYALHNLNADLGIIMYDECHHTSSKTSQEVMYALTAPIRFGFSGTPLRYERLSDLLLIGATGPIVVDVNNDKLIKAGVSARPVVDMYVVESKAADYEADWKDAYPQQIVNNVRRNAIIAQQIEQRNCKAALVLVDRVEHGKLLQHLYGGVFVHGEMPSDVRKAVLADLRTGAARVVIATPIFDEGVDVPAIDLLVMAGGGKQPIRLLQRLGRGMRRKAGKNTLQVLDFVDDTNEFLLKHSYERARIYERQGFEVKIHPPIETSV